MFDCNTPGLAFDVELYSEIVVCGKGLGYDIYFLSNFIFDCNKFGISYDEDLYSEIVVTGIGLGCGID